MTQMEEQLLQSKMMEILDRLDVSQMEFERTMQMYSMDQMKGMEIMQIQQSTQAGDDDLEVLSRDKALEVFKKKLKIQMDQMDEVLEE